MQEKISISKFRSAIRKLHSDEPVDTPNKWYKTQKEHWLGWLKEYRTSGAYNRSNEHKRDARFAYNHIVEPKMLAWLIDASGARPDLSKDIHRILNKRVAMQTKSAMIRELVHWEEIESKLFKQE